MHILIVVLLMRPLTSVRVPIPDSARVEEGGKSKEHSDDSGLSGRQGSELKGLGALLQLQLHHFDSGAASCAYMHVT